MWSELVSSAFVAGLSVAWIREALPPPLHCKPGALGLWAGPGGTGVGDGSGCSQGFVFKSKVFALISARSVRQNQSLKA